MDWAQLWNIGFIVFVTTLATLAAELGIAKVLRWLDRRQCSSKGRR